jgi:hypothetical protein
MTMSTYEATLARYGASHFGYMTSPTGAQVAFQYAGRQVRFVLELPDRQDREFTHHARGARTKTAAAERYEQAVRQRWRALALVVKAKLEAVEAGIATFEQEFFAHTVLPSGRTVYEDMHETVARVIASGDRAPLMLEG